ncbi:unnamed protein product [Arctia plantaginis]|uniref:Little elongation complex subunit 2 C-terminal domain-containing protein n=1 Tax=Arctia plantaginis TaxID=874455 RepID=A0A8S1A2X1_ARCPL|nr:unnamed protein product [Arctia plantaginis]
MMDHIRQFDWCTSTTSGPFFIEESVLDNCNTEKIITNRFVDPLASSDDEEHPPNVIDWDNVFKNKDSKQAPKMFVPGLRPVAQYPKLSALTAAQHHKGLKVLCAMYPNILEEMHILRPTQMDRRNFEVLNEVYEKEQKEYIEWAKSLWVSAHCVRALRPKPAIETIYEAEFKVRAHRLSGYPQRFDMAAQIPLACTKPHQYEATLKETLIDVHVRDLPHVSLPQPIVKLTSIIKPCTVPEPCHKHPYPFILPTETSVSILPIMELHRELAQYAAANGSKFIASENSLRCLMEFNRHWSIPVTVCSVFNHEGERCNVIVLDSEFTINKEPATIRTFKAFRHLLEHTLIPSSEVEKAIEKMKNNKQKEPKKKKHATPFEEMDVEPELSSDEEPLGLCIMEDYDVDNAPNSEKSDTTPAGKTDQDYYEKGTDSPSHKNKAMANGDVSLEDINDIIGVYNCTCSDTMYEIPPRRSFKKWQITNNTTQESVDFIVHCSHKARQNFSELILEPVPEYQLELGASEQSPDRIRSLALSLMLRKNASVLTGRVDACSGDLVTLERAEAGQLRAEQGPRWRQALNALHTTLSELQGLVPGHYVLKHEPSHFDNAFLYVSRPHSISCDLQLQFDSSQLIEPDEAKMAKTAPTLTPVLLPYHKYRNILPCAFSPFESHLQKDAKKPPAKQKTPPQALKNEAEQENGRSKVSVLRFPVYL